jgi:hypothetical protein
MDFETALSNFVNNVNTKSRKFYAENNFELDFYDTFIKDLEIRKGRKYIKLVSSGSVHSFIDKNGNVLKAANWNTPAKRARGNIFENNGDNALDYRGAIKYLN